MLKRNLYALEEEKKLFNTKYIHNDLDPSKYEKKAINIFSIKTSSTLTYHLLRTLQLLQDCCGIVILLLLQTQSNDIYMLYKCLGKGKWKP